MTGILNLLAGAVSSAIKDAYFNLTTLLLPGDGTNGAQNNTFLDSSSNNFTITRNGNTTQGTFSPFSQTGWSNYFDGTGDSLTVPDNAAFDLGSGAFTVEAWVYYTATNNYGIVCGQWGGVAVTGASAWIIRQDNASKFQFVYTTNGTTETSLTATNAFSLNTWNHVVACKDSSNNWALFMNGARQATSTASATIFNSTYSFSIGGAQNTTDLMTGYVSNVRVVKGTAVYDPTQSTLTVPTAPLTAITNTSFLSCQSNRFIDNSTNAFTITRNGDVSVQAFSPFAPTAAYSAATVGGSGYFDGNGDYLVGNGQLSTSTSMSTFTVEGWLYPTSLANNYWIIGDMDAVGATNVLSVRTGINGDLVLYWYDGAVKECFSPNGSIRANQWNWFAIVVNNNAISMYVNSTTAASLTGTTTLTNRTQTNNFALGQQNNSVTFLGYMGNLRWSSGIARTISSIPTAPYTSDANTRLLVNFTNAGITDATAKNVLETVGNAQISTTQSKFGGSSMYFDGTGDWLSTRMTENLVLRSDFTLEAWVYPTTITGSSRTILFLENGANSATFYISSSGILNLDIAGVANYTLGSTAVTTNSWQYIAFVRSGSTLTGYINGSSVGTATVTASIGSTGSCLVGANSGSGGAPFFGYMDDLRLTKGYARTITTPTAAFPTQ